MQGGFSAFVPYGNPHGSWQRVAPVARTFTVIIERDAGGGFLASVPELLACHTQREPGEEVCVRIREAVNLYLEDEPLQRFPQFVALETIEAPK